jgi:DMSO/TMAO reductase YedYZ molybdopterin-dependent catalytic subunit
MAQMEAAAFEDLLRRSGKGDLVVLEDVTLNAEAPVHLLRDAVTPIDRFFVRNNGALPSFTAQQLNDRRLVIDGEVDRPLNLNLDEIRSRFETVTEEAVLECAGNGRRNFTPPTDGLQWGEGAIGCARWTGVRLADLLRAAGPRPSACYTAHFSGDRDPKSDGPALSRGLPLWKALSAETLVAFAMNGSPLTPLHGAPMRIVAPGFPGSAWQKWLERITLRDREHDGAKMTGYDYRLPARSLQPGEKPDASEMKVIEDMPVKSLIVSPFATEKLEVGQPVQIDGFAWSGHTPLAGVDVSTDGGRDWKAAELSPAGGAFAWVPFRLSWTPASAGRFALMPRARNARGVAQPIDEAPWNPKGYANNRCQKVEVLVA